MTETVYMIYLWRKNEDFPEVYDAWESVIVDHENPEGFNEKVEEAKAMGEVRIVKIKYKLDPVALFAEQEIDAEVTPPAS